MMIKVLLNGEEENKYFLINEDELKDLNVDEDGEWIEDNEVNFAQGFCYDDKWIVDHESSCQGFEIVDFKELNRSYDLYGIGYDGITALVDGEEIELKISRWQGQTGYYTEA